MKKLLTKTQAEANVASILILVFVLLFVGSWPVKVPCMYCGKTIITETLAARIYTKWEKNFSHFG